MQVHVSVLSTQGQLTVPIAVRRELNLLPGGQLIWEIDRDSVSAPRVVVRTHSISSLKKLRGAGKKLYQEKGGGKQLLDTERNSWEA